MLFLEPCVLFIGAALGLLCLIYPTEYGSFVASSDYFGPDGFPTVIASIMLATCLFRAIFYLRERPYLRGKKLFDTDGQMKIFLNTIAIICIFIISFIYIGFYTTILFYFIIFPRVLDDDVKIHVVVPYAACLVLVCWIMFRFFKIYLPDTLLI